MRKLLIGTTALAAAGIVAAPAAFAGEAPSLSVSGQARIAYIQRDVDGAGNADGADGSNIAQANAGTEIRFRANGVADNGLEYGYTMDWRHSGGTTSQTIDESYIHFAGGWGRIHFGGDDGVVENMARGGASVAVGNYGFDYSHSVISNTTSLVSTMGFSGQTFDDAKVAYYSPSFGGFSFGASIQPDITQSTDTRAAGEFNDGANGNYGDTPLYEIAAQYSGSFGDVGLSVGGGFAYAEGNVNGAGAARDDLESFRGGATVSIAGFSLGAGYMDGNDTNCVSGLAGCDGESQYSLGAAYSFGAGAVSVTYMNAEGNENGGATEDELTQFHVDAEYYVAEGLTAYAQYGDVESDNDGTETESSWVLVGTTVSF